MAESMARGTPRDHAMEYWEDLSIISRIRRWKHACNTADAQSVDPTSIAEQLAESANMRDAVSRYEQGVARRVPHTRFQ